MATELLPPRTPTAAPTGVIPPALALLGIVLLPVWAMGVFVPWSGGAGSAVIAWLSLPLFVAACASPLTLRSGRKRAGLMLTIIAITYFISFGLRTLYLLQFRDLSTFPQFDPETDLIHLHRGLLWAAVGVYAMTFAYAFGAPPSPRGPGRPLTSLVLDRVRFASTVPFLVGLYTAGLLGRAFALGTGSALWIYNSPAFDRFSARPDPLAGGVMAIIADFCPVAVGALIALAVGTRPARRSLVLLIAPMLLIELVYYSFGLYKFGLFAVLIIPWVSLHIAGRRPPVRIVLPVVVVLILLATPIIGAARSNLLGYYTGGGGLSVDWLRAIGETSGDNAAGTTTPTDAVRALLDPLFARLNGPEALAVAEEHVPENGYELGKTYGNLAFFALPRILRPWEMTPYYVAWETKYVGQKSFEYSVVPMPAIVEAFLNFGWLGVIVAMAALGRMYRFIDSFVHASRGSPLLIGLLAYVCWRMINIEHNVFIILLPTAKVAVAVVVFAVAWSAVPGRHHHTASPAPR